MRVVALLVSVPLIATAALPGCGGVRERELAKQGWRHAPSDYAVSWQESSGLVVFREDQWMLRWDHRQPRCVQTGLYTADTNGKWQQRRLLPALCDTVGVFNLAVSRDAQRIFFGGGQRLESLDLSSGHRATLADMLPGAAQLPAPAPDGRKVLFYITLSSVGRDGRGGLMCVLESAGSATCPLRDLGHDELWSAPSWAPDSRSIAFSVFSHDSARYETRGSLVVADASAANWRVVAAGDHPSWSPTGDWIAYVSYVVRLDSLARGSGAPARILAPEVRVVRPDGRDDRLVYASGDSTLYGEGGWRTVNGSPKGPLVWSPDGRRIAFSREFIGQAILWVVDLDGRGLRRVSPELSSRE
jgi:Tol biopolymer transport system component/uncharacterized protein YceK